MISSSDPFFLQKDATDALGKMTSVLKVESTAGERYESLFDGAKSLVNCLSSILRVASYEASVYDSHSQEKSHIKASFIITDERLARESRKFAFKSRTYSPYLWAKRSQREASNAQLQVKNVEKYEFKTYINKLQ